MVVAFQNCYILSIISEDIIQGESKDLEYIVSVATDHEVHNFVQQTLSIKKRHQYNNILHCNN